MYLAVCEYNVSVFAKIGKCTQGSLAWAEPLENDEGDEGINKVELGN